MQSDNFSLLIYKQTASLECFALKFTNDADDSKDLMQETVIKALRYQKNFEPGSSLRGWLFTIMKNIYINNFRKNKKISGIISLQNLVTEAQLVMNVNRNLSENRFAMNDIQGAIASLPEIYSRPFMLFFEGYKYEEIAHQMHIPIGTVKTRIHSARKALKLRLPDYRDNFD